MALFDVAGDNLDPGYMNLRAGEFEAERQIVAALEAMWLRFQPYADADYRAGFARDPDGRFWEMYLACALLDAGQHLLPRANFPQGGGCPDICVVEGERRVWIEAIAPDIGNGEDQVPELIPVNEGGHAVDQPLRQVHLRITSALLTKSRVLQGYLDREIIRDGDLALAAISGSRFALQAAGDDPPHALTAVYPIGNEFIRINPDNMQIAGHGYHRDEQIQRAGAPIQRTAFLHPYFEHVSGLIWSRAGIGNMDRGARPLTLIHNYAAVTEMPRGWDVWDREYIADIDRHGLRLTDLCAQ